MGMLIESLMEEGTIEKISKFFTVTPPDDYKAAEQNMLYTVKNLRYKSDVTHWLKTIDSSNLQRLFKKQIKNYPERANEIRSYQRWLDTTFRRALEKRLKELERK